MNGKPEAETAERGPCGRIGCGSRLLCCRPDCPLVTVDMEPGLKRIYTRAEFVAECRKIVAQATS